MDVWKSRFVFFLFKERNQKCRSVIQTLMTNLDNYWTYIYICIYIFIYGKMFSFYSVICNWRWLWLRTENKSRACSLFLVPIIRLTGFFLLAIKSNPLGPDFISVRGFYVFLSDGDVGGEEEVLFSFQDRLVTLIWFQSQS